jgi:hypothetical protein
MNQRSRANQILLINRQRNYPLASIPWRLQQFRIQRHFITGHGSAYVTAIAMDTELGHIAQMIQSQDQPITNTIGCIQ